MADRWGVNFFESHACSGNSLDTNQEGYLDRNIFALNLTGAYSLNGWVDATPNKLQLNFHCLGPHEMEQAHCLIKEFCIVYVPQFKRYGSLYPVLLA